MRSRSTDPKISVTLNGNKISISQDESLLGFVSQRVKIQKIKQIQINGADVPVHDLDRPLVAGDAIFIERKTKSDTEEERIGLRTWLKYFVSHLIVGIKWRCRRFFNRGVIVKNVESVKKVKFRADTRESMVRSGFAEKEPDTIRWLARLGPDDTLLDVGANVGAVTIYAAVARGCRVISCEPNALNYELLLDHIALNDLAARVCPLNLAVSDESSISNLFIKNPSVGASGNSFSQAVDQEGRSYDAILKQSCLGLTVDDLVRVSGAWTPNFLKVDVDGFEDLVFAGASEALHKHVFDSIAVEIDLLRPGAKDKIVSLLGSYHYSLRSVGGEIVDSDLDLPERGHVFNFIFDKL